LKIKINSKTQNFVLNMSIYDPLLYFLLTCSIFACQSEPKKRSEKPPAIIEEKNVTKYSTAKNEYTNFNSVKAINKIAIIENEYFKDRKKGVSKYYGTVWRELAEQTTAQNKISQYQDYLNELRAKPDSLHCTLYAYEGLKAGLTPEQFSKLEQRHKTIYKSHEIAVIRFGRRIISLRTRFLFIRKQ